jgi:hypothetical protein
MSGYSAEIIARQGVLDEEFQFLQKPFSANDLTTQIRKALRIAGPEQRGRYKK